MPFALEKYRESIKNKVVKEKFQAFEDIMENDISDWNDVDSDIDMYDLNGIKYAPNFGKI